MHSNPQLEVHLVMGARSPDTAIYKEDFRNSEQLGDNFHLSICYSRLYPDKAASNSHRGRVQNRFEKLDANPDTDMVYLCGNPSMVETSAEYFKERGFSPKNLKQEKYKFSSF